MAKEKKSMNILSLEAKDIFIAMTANPKVGYNICGKDKKISLHKFKNTLDWSLDRDKLEEAYKNNLNGNNMAFDGDDGKQYTLAVINLEFSLNVKEYNKNYKNFIRFGYAVEENDFTNGLCVKDGKLIALQTGVDVSEPESTEILGKYFEYRKNENEENGRYYQVETNSGNKKNISIINTADDFYEFDTGIYIRFGYTIKDCKFKDGLCIKKGELIAIQTDIDILKPVKPEILGETFEYSIKKKQYSVAKNHKGKMDTAKLREYLYENGFHISNGKEKIHYVRYKRSAGSAREGKCLFVDERLANDMAEWDRCGLTIDEGWEIDLASWEAYIALSMSGIIGTINIKPNNILMVKEDVEKEFQDQVVAVDGRGVATEETVDYIKNKIWDGESLLDSSMFTGEYQGKGMLVLRNRFFKTCAFNTNIQQWFIDKNITLVDIKQKGYTKAEKIEDIKLIITPSSLKFLKFGGYIKHSLFETLDDSDKFYYWLDKIDSKFGVVKYEKKTKYFGGKLVQTHYQLLNTLQLSDDDLHNLLEPSREYLKAMRKDPAVLRYHIGYRLGSENTIQNSEAEEYDEENEFNDEDNEFEGQKEEEEYLKTIYEIISFMLDVNNDFSKTKLYKDFRDQIVNAFKDKLKSGRILVNGNYSTLFGNGMELLKYATNRVDDKSGVIDPGSIHTKRFPYGKTLLGSRSPHITMGNILLAKNVANKTIDKYFNMTDEIVYITSINDNILNRLNGADFDSDTMLLTDNEILINAAQKNYKRCKVPYNDFPHKDPSPRRYTAKGKAELDYTLDKDKVGEITNLSQALNSLYWDRINKGESPDSDDIEELYRDICVLAVLCGYEIDKAKKLLPGDSSEIIEALKNKYLVQNGITHKPKFFEKLALKKGTKSSGSTVYIEFETSMDKLLKEVQKIHFRRKEYEVETDNNPVPFMNIIRKYSGAKSGNYNKTRDEIIQKIKDCKDEIDRIQMNNRLRGNKGSQEDTQESVSDAKKKYMDVINNKVKQEYLIYILLDEIEKKENSKIRKLMFEILFGTPKSKFRDMVEGSATSIDELVQDDNGAERYFDIGFTRITRTPAHRGFQFQTNKV